MLPSCWLPPRHGPCCLLRCCCCGPFQKSSELCPAPSQITSLFPCGVCSLCSGLSPFPLTWAYSVTNQQASSYFSEISTFRLCALVHILPLSLVSPTSVYETGSISQAPFHMLLVPMNPTVDISTSSMKPTGSSAV
jgi:hypothetical protein